MKKLYYFHHGGKDLIASKDRIVAILIIASVIFLSYRADVASSPSSGSLTLKPGDRLVVGVTHDPPYLIKHPNGEWGGLNMEILQEVAQTLKIDFELREMTFAELLDALRNKQIDMSIEAFYITAERERFIDFTYPFGSTRLAIATLPDKIPHPWWAALQIILSWGTLKIILSLGIVLCVLGFFLWLIERKENPDHFGGKPIKGISSGIYWAGSTLASGVCFGIALKSLTARILGILWMLACALALSALIASLSSTLTASKFTTEMVNEDVLRRMHLAGIQASAESVPLKNMGGRYTLFGSENEMLSALINHKVEGVLYDEISLHYYRDFVFRDKIVTYPTSFKRFQCAFGLPNNSKYRGDINYALLTIMEKPDWINLLKRYGLTENFEGKEAPVTRRKGRHSLAPDT